MQGLILGLISVTIGAAPGPSARELNAQGYALYQAGDYPGALEAFRRATQAAPSLSIALYNQAAVAVKLGVNVRPTTFVADLEVSIAQDPTRLARLKVDHDFDPLRTTLAFQRLISAPDTHTVAGLTALLPKLRWWRASMRESSIDTAHTQRLLAGGRYEIEGQPAGTWKLVARPKLDPLVVIEVAANDAHAARTLTGQLLPDGRLVFDDEWWTNERLTSGPQWVDAPEASTGAEAAQRLIDEALTLEKTQPESPDWPLRKLLAAIDAAPRTALAYYELARLRGAMMDPCRDESSEGVSDLEAAFALDPTLRARAKNDAQLAGLGANIAFWVLLGSDLRKPADVSKLLPKLLWNYGPPSYSDSGWGRFYAFKEKGRFEISERYWTDDGETLMDSRVGTWRVVSGPVVVIDLPASERSKAQHLVGHLTRDGRLLFETEWWRSGVGDCCC